jgi:hypothetical protein
VASAKQYREYAEECLKWAKDAQSDEYREALIQLAQDWLLAATKAALPPTKAELPPQNAVSPLGK